jgi:selenocysteine-specific elongation factor
MIIGTAGHIDHGKTSLVRALTGVDTDRLKEEKKRGISIDLGFAFMPAPDGSVLGFIDVPGHEAFVHNMLAGASGIDVALLVVAADDGVMPQTREHLAIVDLLGVRSGVIALTKADLADDARRQAVEAEIAATVAGTALSGAHIIPVSVVSGEGVDTLRDELFALTGQIAERKRSGRFRLAVDRSFVLQGAGTVVTGTILSGSVSVGDHVTISPSGLSARVRSIHAQNTPREQADAGERCALNLAGDGISKDAIHRGDVVLDPVLHAPTDRIDCSLRILPSETRPVAQWTPVHLHHAASDIGARIVLFGDEPVPPGGEAFAQLVLDRPIAPSVGDRFVLRDTTAQRTIGGGRFIDLRAPSRKRRTPERLAQIEAHAIEDAAEALTALVGRAPHFVDLPVFMRDRALGETEQAEVIRSTSVMQIHAGTSVLALSPATWLTLKRNVLAALEAYHAANPDQPGMGFERLRLQLTPRLPAPSFMAFLHGLAETRDVGLDGAWVRRAGHEVRLTEADERIWTRMRPLLGGGVRFRPPRVRDMIDVLGVSEEQIRRLLKLLGRMGKVDEVAHDHFFLRDAVAEMVAIAADIAGSSPKGEFTAAQLRDRLDNGRKVAIQILDFFDRHGVTMRRGDLRRINRHRLDLFRPTAVKPDQDATRSGRESSPVGRPDFKSGKDREPVLGGFDSLSLPPLSREATR